jgi:RNA-directed DNA polymerase
MTDSTIAPGELFWTRVKPRLCRNGQGPYFIGYTPAVNRKALKRMGGEVRSWHISRKTEMTIEELSAMYNPIIRGWLVYFGKYRPSELGELKRSLNHSQSSGISHRGPSRCNGNGD